MAVTLTAVFLYFNGQWLDVSPLALYKIATVVADSKSQERQAIVNILDRFFRRHTVPTKTMEERLKET